MRILLTLAIFLPSYFSNQPPVKPRVFAEPGYSVRAGWSANYYRLGNDHIYLYEGWYGR
jgi:hypothetical protein